MAITISGTRSQVSAFPMPKVGRVMRRPQHNFYLRQRPFIIQPFMLAPVLAGETMKNLLLQARVVTDPIKNPLIGWWKEYYFFYVPLTRLDELYGNEDETTNDSFVGMLLNSATFDKTAHASYLAVANTDLYRGAVGQIDMVKSCQQAIVNDWFRPEDETYATAAGIVNTMPTAAINHTSWIDSLTIAAGVVRPDVNVDLNADTVIKASEVDEALRRWQWARSTGLTDLSYDDYLASFGVQATTEQTKKTTELLRYVRDWTYPTNTVEPTTGVPASACSWSIQERADKDRFFKEPGFIVGITCTRPKVYLSNLKNSLGNNLDRGLDWLPAHLKADAWSALKQFATGTGPIPAITDVNGYWVDIRDLFTYGDQFLGFGTATTGYNEVGLPTTTGGKRYVAAADISALFKTATTAEFVREDGTVSLTIAGTQMDYTGTT